MSDGQGLRSPNTTTFERSNQCLHVPGFLDIEANIKMLTDRHMDTMNTKLE